MKVLNCMTKKPVTLKEENNVLSAVKEMQEYDCSFLPVVDDNHNIQGIVTNRDIIVKAIAKDKDLSKMPITDIMSKNMCIVPWVGFSNDPDGTVRACCISKALRRSSALASS